MYSVLTKAMVIIFCVEILRKHGLPSPVSWQGSHTQVVDATMPGVWCCFLSRRSESHFSMKHGDDDNFPCLEFAQAYITELRVLAWQPYPGCGCSHGGCLVSLPYSQIRASL
nr:hypothetical protein [Tanacetum cinerariifolium]